MTEELKSLIEKIQQEGVQAGAEKAAALEATARKQADKLLAQAQKEAQEMLRQAESKISSLEEKTRSLLAQAGRDMLLALRKEVDLTLERLLKQDLREVLSAGLLEKVLHELIVKSAHAAAGEIVVSVSAHDFKALQEGLFAKLKNEIKKGLTLRAAEGIHAGFTISFDSGKSQFDFSDQAMAEYIGTYLKPNLKKILSEATA